MSLTPSARRLLAALQDAGDKGLSTSQLCQPALGGVRFGARVHDLRQAGYRISETRVRQGSSRYVLEPQDEEGAIVLDFCCGMYDCCGRAA